MRLIIVDKVHSCSHFHTKNTKEQQYVFCRTSGSEGVEAQMAKNYLALHPLILYLPFPVTKMNV